MDICQFGMCLHLRVDHLSEDVSEHCLSPFEQIILQELQTLKQWLSRILADRFPGCTRFDLIGRIWPFDATLRLLFRTKGKVPIQAVLLNIIKDASMRECFCYLKSCNTIFLFELKQCS